MGHRTTLSVCIGLIFYSTFSFVSTGHAISEELKELAYRLAQFYQTCADLNELTNSEYFTRGEATEIYNNLSAVSQLAIKIYANENIYISDKEKQALFLLIKRAGALSEQHQNRKFHFPLIHLEMMFPQWRFFNTYSPNHYQDKHNVNTNVRLLSHADWLTPYVLVSVKASMNQ